MLEVARYRTLRIVELGVGLSDLFHHLMVMQHATKQQEKFVHIPLESNQSLYIQLSTDAPSTLAAVRRRRFARNSTTGPPDLNRSIDLAVAEHEERNKNSFANNYKSFSFNKADEKHLIRPKPKNVAFTFMWFLRAGGLCQFTTAMVSSLVQGSLFTSWAIILALECEVCLNIYGNYWT